MTCFLRFFLALLPLLFATPIVHAEQADRNKPIALEADRITIDDLKRIQTLEGNVVLTQGTLSIRADKIVITEDAYGFQHGVALAGPGKLVRFRQKREGREGWIDGEAERIEYNTQKEIAELFRRAWIKSGSDQLRGDYIWYDAISERYLATGGARDSKNPAAPPSRVSVTLQPKSAAAPARKPGEAPKNEANHEANPEGAPPQKNPPAQAPSAPL
jgi:lipopolysaccharide export system protein LptA